MKTKPFIILALFMGYLGFAQTKTKVPFSQVEISPIYPGCNDAANAEIKKCTQESIDAFLKANFNTNLLKPNHKKVGIHFLITDTGAIEEISAAIRYKYLEEEVVRIVSLLPPMEPGKRRGQKIGVLYGTILDYSERKKS
ncbi:MAG: hypothetical protein Aureis2KO_31460 [Aureisphaera sp.]